MSDKHRAQLHARMGAFGIKMRTIESDQRMIEVACIMFQVEAGTVDEVWRASVALGRKERSRRARAARSDKSIAHHYTTVDWAAEARRRDVVESGLDLDAEREERIMLAKVRASTKHLPPTDERRTAVDAFLRRSTWAEATDHR
ncbi:hypothetical protein ACFPOB_27205 [Bosea eneae]|uniref:Uncharacterized protein n=1 Tax=Bosea eneae TaxID=151454 RepID=A0ABW0IY34_9HYPH